MFTLVSTQGMTDEQIAEARKLAAEHNATRTKEEKDGEGEDDVAAGADDEEDAPAASGAASVLSSEDSEKEADKCIGTTCVINHGGERPAEDFGTHRKDGKMHGQGLKQRSASSHDSYVDHVVAPPAHTADLSMLEVDASGEPAVSFDQFIDATPPDEEVHAATFLQLAEQRGERGNETAEPLIWLVSELVQEMDASFLKNLPTKSARRELAFGIADGLHDAVCVAIRSSFGSSQDCKAGYAGQTGVRLYARQDIDPQLVVGGDQPLWPYVRVFAKSSAFLQEGMDMISTRNTAEARRGDEDHGVEHDAYWAPPEHYEHSGSEGDVDANDTANGSSGGANDTSDVRVPGRLLNKMGIAVSVPKDARMFLSNRGSMVAAISLVSRELQKITKYTIVQAIRTALNTPSRTNALKDKDFVQIKQAISDGDGRLRAPLVVLPKGMNKNDTSDIEVCSWNGFLRVILIRVVQDLCWRRRICSSTTWIGENYVSRTMSSIAVRSASALIQTTAGCCAQGTLMLFFPP